MGDRAFRARGRDRLASPVALAVVDQRALISLDVAVQLRATRDKAPGLRLHRGSVEQDGVLGPARDPAQGLARRLVVAVPEQVSQALHIDLRVLERPTGGRLQGVEAEEGLLDMAHAHGKMSGSRASLPRPSPLRTGRDDCSSSGSSLCRPVPGPRMVRMVAPPVYQLQVVQVVRSAVTARDGVVFVDEWDVLIRVGPYATHGALVVLSSQQA